MVRISSYLVWSVIIIIIICVFHSCFNSLKRTDRECQGLKEFLGDNWKYNAAGDYYEEGPNIVELTSSKLPYADCINGMHETNIIKLFGSPNRVDTVNNRLIYYESPDCHENWERCPFFLSFDLDKSSNVSKFGLNILIISIYRRSYILFLWCIAISIYYNKVLFKSKRFCQISCM